MNGPVVATITARRFAAYARVLVESLARWHPELAVRVLAVESLAPTFSVDDPRVVDIRRLPETWTRPILFGYDEREAAIALKPVWIEHLLETHASVLYLDADSWVLGDLEPLLAAWLGHEWTLVPHLVAPPLGEDRRDRELRILRAGTFNGGVVGVGRSPRSTAVVDWWRRRVTASCEADPARGLHHDQRWLDLVPGFVADSAILRDPGIDVAYWNLPERPLRREPSGDPMAATWWAGGAPLRLFHFSGFDPLVPGRLTRHAPSPLVAGEPAAELAALYSDRLIAAGHRAIADHEYDFGRFSNGVRVPAIGRKIFREQLVGAERFGDPFDAAGESSFFAFLRTPAAPGSAVSRLWEAVYRSRVDVRRAYPDPHGADQRAFLAWTRTSGLREHDIDPELLD